MKGDDIGGGLCLKGQAKSELLGVRSQDAQTGYSLHVRKAFFSANLWTPRVFLKLTWRSMELMAGWQWTEATARKSTHSGW